MTFLSTQNLSKSYGGLQAVNNVNFNLEQGEIRAVIGPNGAGKTTFVSLLSGRVTPTSGSIIFADQDITNTPIHQRVRLGIAYTFQITSIFQNLTVLENATIAAQNHYKTKTETTTTNIQPNVQLGAQTALEQVGLSDMQNARAGEIAYGHQRLLEVAMGLALKPRLLILDEPTQGLSDPEIADFISLVKQINQTTTVLLIEHNMSLVMALAHNITVLDQGAILAEGNPQEIQQNPAVQSAYLGT